MRILSIIIILVFLFSLAVLGNTNQLAKTTMIIEPEIELPTIKIPLPEQKSTSQEIPVQNNKIKAIQTATIEEQTEKEFSPPKVETNNIINSNPLY